MSKPVHRVTVELTYTEPVTRERLTEILADALYRPDVAMTLPLQEHESAEPETLHDGVTFKFDALVPDESMIGDHVPGKSFYDDYIEAFRIFAKYPGSPHGMSARHKEVYAGPNPRDVSAEDKKRLEELGWNDYGDFRFHKFT